MEIDKSLVSGSMALLVLKLLEDGDKYGYQMIDELRCRSDDTFHLKAGSLYPLLHGLEEKGLVTAYEREAAAGKPRRYYHLTKQGGEALREKEETWNVYARAVGRVLGEASAVGKPETIRDYLSTVEEQIRWKRAKPVVCMELERHLEDQRDDFAAEGHAPEEAERLAVEDMGDPVEVGTELDRLHRPKPQWGLLAVTLAVALVGAVLRVVLTACGAQWFDNVDPVLAGSSVVLGGACLLGAYFLDYSRLLHYAKAVYVGALVLGVLTLWLSPMRNNASYYTRYVVLLYPTVYAVWLYACRGNGWKGLFLAITGGVPLAVISMLVPYTLGLFLVLLVGLVLLLAAIHMDWFGVSKTWATVLVVTLAGVCAALVTARLLLTGYGSNRLLMLLHPELDPLGHGYQALSARNELALSQWLGEGQRIVSDLPYPSEMLLPEWNHDFFLTTIIYKLGWLPFLLLMAALAGLLVWLLLRCLRQRSQGGRLVALSVVLALAIQAAFSVVLNMGYIVFSASMPLLVGNLHSVVDMALIGLALSVFRGESIAREFDPAAPRPRQHVQILVLISNEKSAGRY